MKAKRSKSAQSSRLVGAEGASAAGGSRTSAAAQTQAVAATAQATSADVATQAQAAEEIAAQPVENRNSRRVRNRRQKLRLPASRSGCRCAKQRQIKRRNVARRFAADKIKPARSQYRQRTRRRYFADSGQRNERSRDEKRHYVVYRIGRGAQARKICFAKARPSFAPPVAQPQTAQKAEYTAPQLSSAVGDRVEPMSVMRKKIAEHMTFSKQTSAHVTSVYEFDMTNVAKFREKNKAEFQARYGTKLTYMPFIFQAVTHALRQIPIVNSQISGEQIIYKGDINLGMAVALDWGLIVPVIKRADQLSLRGLALAANDLADRARTKKLMPDEVAGGTFTITNPGVFGGLFGTPIINQPQVAILCVGTIEKRPKVLTTPDGDDYIAIRRMAYFALTYDHRIVDGSDGEKFLSLMKNYLETTQFSL